LDLALLVDREDDGVGGRIDVETDDVAQLFAWWLARQDDDELGARIVPTNLDRTVQLRYERGSDLHAQPLRPGKFEALRQPGALVPNGNRQLVVSNTGDPNLHP
jgi:hypothetical protein